MKISLTYLFCIVLFFSNMRAYSQDFYGSKTLTEIRNDELVEMKTLKNSFAIGLQCGYFGLFSFAKANEYSSNVRIGDYHNQCNLNIEIQKHLKIELSCGYKSLRTSVYNKQDHTSYTFFPFNWDKMGNTLETIKSTGTTLQISFYYSLF